MQWGEDSESELNIFVYSLYQKNLLIILIDSK
jgi:hypothetical protein